MEETQKTVLQMVRARIREAADHSGPLPSVVVLLSREEARDALAALGEDEPPLRVLRCDGVSEVFSRAAPEREDGDNGSIFYFVKWRDKVAVLETRRAFGVIARRRVVAARVVTDLEPHAADATWARQLLARPAGTNSKTYETFVGAEIIPG